MYVSVHINKGVSVCYCLYVYVCVCVCVCVCVYGKACVPPSAQGAFCKG